VLNRGGVLGVELLRQQLRPGLTSHRDIKNLISQRKHHVLAKHQFKMLITRIAALLLTAVLSSASRLTITIPPSPPLLPNPSTLPSTTHAILLGPPGIRYDVPIRRDNTFVFPSLDAASYLLTIHSRDHTFPPFRIDVTSEAENQRSISAWQTFRGNEWSNKGPLYGTAQDELKIDVRPIGQKDFYEERQSFSLVGFLKSPMILMALVSVGMIFGLPYLMDNSMSTIIQRNLFRNCINKLRSGSRNEGGDGGNAAQGSNYGIGRCSRLK
jgi:hypothetical protein